ncbi:MAG: DUF2092 domain-containing protein [Alphaproteobacteria bacterium]
MKRGFTVVLASFMVLVTMGDQSYAESNAKIEPKAAEILKRVTSYLGSAKTLSFTAVTMYDVVEKTGIKTLKAVQQDVVLRRPSGLHSRFKDDHGVRRQLWFDGTTLTVLQEDKNTFDTVSMKLSKQPTNDDFLDAISQRFGISFPIIDLLYSKIARNVQENLISGVYLGERTMLDGVQAHHLSLEGRNADWQIWVAVGDQPNILRMAVNYVTMPEQPAFITIMTNWKVNEDVPASRFKPDLPKTAKRQAFLKEMK